ncbi:MAG TPA: SufD family Fe-S cluster assembly protein, partial [Candidatus Acidoferrales bacterium]|nr:SufD family Fe-S cluster assembly protein [Candidatus Acidoferrales bacterium]
MAETILTQQAQVERGLIERILKDEPDWLGDLRRSAFMRYEALPQPDEKTPGWRRLSLTGLDLRAPAPVPTSFEYWAAEDDLKRGLVVCSLVKGLGTHEDAIREALGIEHHGKSVGRYAAIAEAAWQDGIFVFAPEGFEASEPIRIDVTEGTYPRVVVVARANSKLTVAETHRESERVSAGVVDIICGEASAVHYAHVQDCAKTSSVFSHQRATMARNSKLVSLNFGIGGRLARTDVEVELRGEGA